MNINKLLLPILLAGGTLLAIDAQATPIFSVTGGTVAATDPTQMGRLSRNALAQTWTDAETYPGFINTTTAYHYKTYSFSSAGASYLEISADDSSANQFIAAYLMTYTPGNTTAQMTWLGDEGASGYYNFGGVPQDAPYFQVTVPAFSTVLLVVNNTGASNVGTGDLFNLYVNGYVDTNYTDVPDAVTPTVPEPATVALLAAPLAGLALTRRRKASVVTEQEATCNG